MAFISWLGRIVITVAVNMRRSRRQAFLRLDDVPEVPLLDEAETAWKELQRHRLARAFLALTVEERRLYDRRYHGRWSMLEIEQDGFWFEVLAWGSFTDKIVSRLGGDPRRHAAVGVWATGSNGWRCCATASTASARSKRPGSRRRWPRSSRGPPASQEVGHNASRGPT